MKKGSAIEIRPRSVKCVKTVSELSEGTALIEKLLKDEANEQNIGLVYKLRGGRFHNLEFLGAMLFAAMGTEQGTTQA